MTTTEFYETAAAPRPLPAPPSLAYIVGTAWRALRRRHEDRRLLKKLARLEPHVIRDMGFDPAEVYAALAGTWDEVGHDRLEP